MTNENDGTPRSLGARIKVQFTPARRSRSAVVAALALVCASVPMTGASAVAASPECVTTPGGSVLVTSECVDPLYANPVIDSTRDAVIPVPHREVLGHFEGTPVRFEVHLPAAAQWKGRFFQYTYPLTDEQASDHAIEFGAASGAYTVQAGGPTPVVGYRHAAAAAKFAKTVAAGYYGWGSRPIHGYLYGPSGGSFQTVGAAENTTGVWDGFAPVVLGVPMSAPYTFFIRGMADLVLRDDARRISDAVLPGGSGDPYAGLDAAERAMLRELTAFGVPLQGWEDPEYLLGHSQFTPDGLLGFGSLVRQLDRSYADDFWNRPGYLGTERSPLGDVVRAALVDATATVSTVDGAPPTRVTLTGLPRTADAAGLDVTVLAADGVTPVGRLTGTLDAATGVFSVGSGNSDAVLAGLVAGAKVRIDNRWGLALRSYYRHQVPPATDGYAGFDQFRRPDGTPIYPQRALLIGPLIQRSTTGGATYSGKITGKMIVVDNLLDVDAVPYQADWYANRVETALGGNTFGSSFRIWYNDAADHQDAPVSGTRATHLVDWNGMVEQALRDLTAWAEKGVAPPRSTRYDVKGAQVVVPKQASDRRGIQPVVDLSVQGRERVDVAAGRPVTFEGKIAVPPGAGAVVAAAWDFAGSGTFTSTTVRRPQPSVVVRATHTFTRPGTYLVALRGTANRSGDPASRFASVPNLDRVRVVVH